ncbi:nucleotidyl transferase AbiEii/AbiGii toxin family protein [Dyella sp. M7H15-1]|uniref:nucleotidyl transferase AbiEii/AbiGii toxin family protein n=1 Tax=Dyella sp. M7H15-1 TaxID=2501295 RepID=UPI001004FE25|nr:nucleotidyl transferase AbiEii/AbiGii toxin family protein [Dyella sp. M7H15-1]QAU23160.1 nucleotidyl transferase AbiEii/AbiGii toxin family protein [Dyella sp. M7H15-1]
MIPQSFLQAWSATAPWPDFRQVEQDLIISRALCDVFNAPALRGKIAFRGGTAINKLLFQRPLRYSEDIDLVQTQPEPIGATVDAIRDALAWLGGCSRNQAGHSMHLVFRFAPEADLQSTLKLKVEINTREHGNLFGIRQYPFSVENDWYQGQAEIVSFEPEELFGTKLRALLQRRKNRDLFDLAQGLDQLGMDAAKLVACFDHYLALEDASITRAEAEQRMLQKLTRSLTEDIAPLLPAGVRFDDADALRAFERVWVELVSRLRGDPWKSTSKVVAELRKRGYPTLLQGLG